VEDYGEWFSFAIGGGSMNRINCYGFYLLGKYISKIESLGPDSKDLDVALASVRAERLLSTLLHNTSFKLKTTLAASSSLFTGFKHLSDFFEERQDTESSGPASDAKDQQRNLFISGVKLSVDKMETVLSTELALAPIYSVPARGVFSTDSLLDSADDVFEDLKELKAHVPDDAIADTKQAGRCLAFDLPTAAGFHIARATEAVMKKAMDALGCPPLKDSQRNWGNYIKSLDEYGASVSIVHHLNQLKDLHRNPLIHPEVTLDQLEAQQLWSLCTSAMVTMVKEIETRKIMAEAAKQLGEAK
jgi:hypothetical protein